MDKKRLINQRAVAKSQLTRINVFLQNFERGSDTTPVETRLQALPDIQRKFNEAQEELELIDDIEAHSDDREQFETLYYHLTSQMLVLIKEQANAGNVKVTENGEDASSNHSSLENKKDIRLPTIKLPIFAGDVTQFRHFYDMFNSLIVKNESLDDIQRFHYLLSSVIAEAHKLIENLPVIGRNFEVAWSMICRRYDNPRLIAAAHINHLLHLPTVNKQSPGDLRVLLNQTLSNMNAIKALDLQMPIHDLLISQMILERIDHPTRKEWELQSSSSEQILSLDDLCEFLETRCKAMDAMLSSQGQTNVTAQKTKDSNDKHIRHPRQSYVSTRDHCTFCKQPHTLYKCNAFAEASVPQRIRFVKNNSLCYNCLQNHHVRECRSRNCRICNRKHHSLLHLDSLSTPQQNQRNPDRDEHSRAADSNNEELAPLGTKTYCSLKIRPHRHVLLSTALVKIRDANGQLQTCRALLDSCSQSHFITEACAQRLNLKRRRNTTSVQGIGQVTHESKYSVFLEVHSNVRDYNFHINCSVLPKITGNLPTNYISHHNWNIPQGFQLADPTFNQPGKIDLLIGSEMFFHLLQPGKLVRDIDHPVIQETVLGWIVTGRYGSSESPASPSQKQTSASFLLRNDDNLYQQLQRFWEIEEVNHMPQTREEKDCEIHFKHHTTRDNSGRFVVRLPLRQVPAQLGDSYQMATRRLCQLERKLNRQPQLQRDYVQFMDEYEALGHMQLVNSVTNTDDLTYYIPHHPVVKESSTTTKVRVVFDASAQSSNGTSLNDLLMVGPTIQPDLFTIIIRFRTYPVCFTADIAKMYRQIKVDPRDCNLQRILWRRESSSPIGVYQLNTVTYGTASAPFLATRCLNQLAVEEAQVYPKAAEILLHDFYVDDCMSGADNMEEALRAQRELIELLNKGGFQLHKWCSNHSALLENIPEELRGAQLPLLLNNDGIKTLGLFWHPASDQFHIVNGIKSRELNDANKPFTKRRVLATTASIFDPLGLISPVVIRCKIFLQQLWQERVSWDEVLSAELTKCWQLLFEQLPLVNDIRVDRLVLGRGIPADIQIHGFADASEYAYGACIYVRSTNQLGEVTSKLLCSKSKVSPLKKLSIPRLELCGALLLARLFRKISNLFNNKSMQSFMWTDSTIVLAWLSSAPTKWKTFIANRVSEIQDLTPTVLWRHVASQDNPADLISRGVNPSDLLPNSLWWNGPAWLLDSPISWPITRILPASHDLPEQRNTVINMSMTIPQDEIITRFSSLTRLQRVVSYCLRFAFNCKSSGSQLTGLLSEEELQNSLYTCVRIAQEVAYQTEIQQLKRSQPLESKSKLKNLNPFLCNNNLLRVGGRLQNSELPYDHKHQIILPPSHHLTRLVVENEHLRMLHANGQLLLSSLRQRFWIVNGKTAIRKILHHCLICRKLKGETSSQLMGQLPSLRVNPARPFLNCGIDYAGPIYVKSGTRRSKIRIKCYIAIFVCLSTRAIHLEVVSDMSTQAFLAALKRFISRRGRCTNIYSDNGTNFVGAKGELKKLQELIQTKDHKQMVTRFAQGEGIKWHFIPPRAPNFGGIWEAGVKSFKYHLRRVMGNECLTFEEMTTLTSQIEACLNSRPLIPLSNDPTDPSVLTPGHFLIGSPLTCIPEPDLVNVKLGLLSRWQLIQRLLQQFWRRWSLDYLSHLQQRTKWTTSSTNVQPGVLCIVKEDNVPPLNWKIAVILELHPGPDGLVRVVTIRTASGQFKRPISKICLLPSPNSS
jgi:hypothetical protein